MNILVLPSFYPNATNVNLGYFFRQQVESLVNDGHNLSVIYVEEVSLRSLTVKLLFKQRFQRSIVKSKGVTEYRVHGWKIPGLLGENLWFYFSIKLFKSFISEKGLPDIIHAHNSFNAGRLAEKIKLIYGVEYIVTEHDSSILNKSISEKRIKELKSVYLNAKSVISVSVALSNSMKSLTNIERVSIIPNIVDTNFFRPANKLKENNVIQFISVGNLTKNKNHVMLIDVIKKLITRNENYNIRLNICGSGPEYDILNSKIRDESLGNNIKLSGFQNRNEMLINYQNSDCFLLSSHYETFGVVLIEAMSCGLPFISTDCGGPSDIYNKSVGVILNENSIDDFVIAIEENIIHNNNFESMVIRNFATSNYSPKVITKKIISEALNIY